MMSIQCAPLCPLYIDKGGVCRGLDDFSIFALNVYRRYLSKVPQRECSKKHQKICDIYCKKNVANFYPRNAIHGTMKNRIIHHRYVMPVLSINKECNFI